MASVFPSAAPVTGKMFFSKHVNHASTDAVSVLVLHFLIVLHACLDFGLTPPRALARAAILHVPHAQQMVKVA